MCPLCAVTSGTELERIPYERIRGSLREIWGIDVTSEVWRRHAPSTDASLVRCDACGLDYFPGAVPADATFYAELAPARGYYEPLRWEFEVVAQRVPAGASVVDFGAGPGDFLRLLKGRAGRLVALDQSPEALAELASAGIEAHAVTFRDFGAHHRGEFDIATGFHIIEHLPDVALLVEPAASVLRQGGRLFISTPNRHRPSVQAFDALDCPPHHISRWSMDQLRQLGDRFGLEVASFEYEPATFSTYVWTLRQRVPGPELIRRAVGRLLRALPSVRRRYDRLRGSGSRLNKDAVGRSIMVELVKQ